MKRTCTGSTKNGTPCRVPPLVGSEPPLCFNHATGPEAEARREAARKRGGEVKAAEAAPAEDAATPPDPLDFEIREDKEGNRQGLWWWWPLMEAIDAEEALAFVVRGVIARRISVREAQAITTAAKALLDRYASQRRTGY